jgi:hypothetical protein
MFRIATRLAVIGAAAAATAVVAPAPAHATVHEIVAQWCSGQDPLGPPGISGGSHADNFAKPLFASGFIGPTVPFDPPGDQPAGLLITFNYGAPQSRTVGTGNYFAIGDTPDGPLYVEQIAPDPSFPAVRNCPRLAPGRGRHRGRAERVSPRGRPRALPPARRGAASRPRRSTAP